MRKISLLLVFLIFKATLMALLITYGPIDLAPDEAQYWTWAKALDIGYYSKPPGIAYQMAFSSAVFGDTHLGIRAGALVVAFLLPLLVYGIARRCSLNESGAFWAAMAMACCPIGMLASLLATTDSAFLLFWTLALWIAVDALNKKLPLPPFKLGIVVFCGALFKWPMFWFWLVVIIGALFVPQWKKKSLLYAIAFSLCAVIPSLIWNFQHDWATFRHVGSTIVVPEGKRQMGNPLEFFGAQIGLLLPIFFGLWIVAVYRIWRRRQKVSTGLLFCSLVSVAIVSVHIGIAFTKKMQGNWCVWAYPAAMIPIGWMAQEMKTRKWHQVAALSSVLVLSIGFLLPSLQLGGGVTWLPHKTNPWRHALGWSKLPKVLEEAGWHHEKDFLFTDRYQTASLLCLYNNTQQRAYFFNLFGARRNQFSYWPQMAEEQLGATGYFVWVENTDRIAQEEAEIFDRYQKALAPYFNRIAIAGRYPLWEVGERTDKIALILRCEGYNGFYPDQAEQY